MQQESEQKLAEENKSLVISLQQAQLHLSQAREQIRSQNVEMEGIRQHSINSQNEFTKQLEDLQRNSQDKDTQILVLKNVVNTRAGEEIQI